MTIALAVGLGNMPAKTTERYNPHPMLSSATALETWVFPLRSGKTQVSHLITSSTNPGARCVLRAYSKALSLSFRQYRQPNPSHVRPLSRAPSPRVPPEAMRGVQRVQKRLCEIKRSHVRLFSLQMVFCRRSMPAKTKPAKKMFCVSLGRSSFMGGDHPRAAASSRKPLQPLSSPLAAHTRPNALTLDARCARAISALPIRARRCPRTSHLFHRRLPCARAPTLSLSPCALRCAPRTSRAYNASPRARCRVRNFQRSCVAGVLCLPQGQTLRSNWESCGGVFTLRVRSLRPGGENKKNVYALWVSI